MKFMKFISFLFTIICCTSYAHENKYIFIGQSGNEGKTAFVLELVGDDFGDNVQINENGEVYLKVDKIIAIPKNTFAHFAYLTGIGSNPQSYSTQTAMASFLALNELNDSYEEMEIPCRKCRYYYIPRCGTEN